MTSEPSTIPRKGAAFEAETWLRRWRAREYRPAIVGDGGTGSYQALAAAVDRAQHALEDHGIERGAVVSVPVGFSVRAAALLLALADRGCIAVPLSDRISSQSMTRRSQASGVGWQTIWGAEGGLGFERERPAGAVPPLIQSLQVAGRPGLVLFTGGTSGEPKGAVHDLGRFLGRYDLAERSQARVLPLLYPDHVGGLDVLWRGLAGGSTIVRPPEAGAEAIARAVETHHVEVIAASPSQLGFLLAAGILDPVRFGSVRKVVHGAESMPAALLQRLKAALPGARFEQRFGTTETGALRVEAREPGSEWFRPDASVAWSVREGELWLQTDGRALGYLHADAGDRFQADNWYRTGDLVEVAENRWLRILGRMTDVINVGGAKVFPTEVEGVVLEIPDVVECTVAAEPNPWTGQVVVAHVVWRGSHPESEILRIVRRHCRARLPTSAVPVKVRRQTAPAVAELKKRRAPGAVTNL